MNRLRILILPMVIAVFGMHCVQGMEPVSDGESSGGRESGLGKRVSRGKIGKERRERARVDDAEEAQDEMVYLLSNDGAEVSIKKETFRRLSLFIGTMIEVSEPGERIEVRLDFSEIVLKKLVKLLVQEHDLLQAGKTLGDVIIAQRSELSHLSNSSELKDLASRLDCCLLKQVLGIENQECFFDYFISGILPLRLLDMTPETFDVNNIFNIVAHQPRMLQRIAIRAIKDQDLCCFYHKLPYGALKDKIYDLVSRAVVKHVGNFAAMPVTLAVTSCLLGLGFKSQILQAFGIDEQWFDDRVLPAIENGILKALLHPGGMNPQQLSFVIECARLLRITNFDISQNGLAALPPEIGLLRELTSLDLSFNRLTALPPEIGQLRSLTHFNVSDNELTALPAEIGQLRALKVLDLSDNELTALPAEIGLLRALTHFNVFCNQLAALPAEIGQLRSLTHFNVLRNQLAALPAEIGLLRVLRFLDLSGNQSLAVLPGEIGQRNRRVLSIYISDTRYGRDLMKSFVTFPGHSERFE